MAGLSTTSRASPILANNICPKGWVGEEVLSQLGAVDEIVISVP